MTITRNFSTLANGAGSANTLSLGGATLGSNALAVTGTTALSGLLTAAGGVSSTLTTDATSATTGSIITAGGISTQKSLWVGTTSRLVGNVQADALVLFGESSSTPTGGGTYRLGIAGNIKFDSGGVIEWPTVGGSAWYQYDSSGTLVFQRGATQAASLGSNGTFAIGTTDTTTYATSLQLYRGSGSTIVCGGLGGQGIAFFANTANANGYNASQACAVGGGYSTVTNRSANFGGTVNASGADYAEYMVKADGCGVITKGSICGVDVTGELTDKFSNAHSFVIKSTNPSYIGGDTWGSVDILGDHPSLRGRSGNETDAAYQTRITDFETKADAARQKVDRIAFSGQVPVNVTGATVGDYIIPVAGPDGGIAGEAVTNPTFDQYRAAVGRVWKILEDGRAFVSVKVS